jgi:3'-phosphoadenosine 5'-phosphosulfate sulfotransferase (PAPS reductase)/FAD synthetase
MAKVEQWAAAIRTKISEAIHIHGRCALPFSGGFESSLLLHLAQPWKDQIVVITVDTGAVFPHVVSFFDKVLAGWNHKAVRTDVRTYLETTAGGRSLVSSSDCCYRHRTGPGQQAVKDLKLRAVLSDQLGGDRNVPADIRTFDGVTNIRMLWGYTRAEVQEMISALGVELPDHYPEFDAPHGCSICPAALTPSRATWMAKLYPEDLATAKKLEAEEVAGVRTALANRKAIPAGVVHFSDRSTIGG